MSQSREYDVVVFGATGFTGRLVAEKLVERAPEGTRIALAGRSLAKLAMVREELGERAASWPLMLADSANRSTMTKLARSTTAVATTVGPYARYGFPLAEACAKAGTHYCDLTAEVLFMRRTAHELDAVARESGARIVHACGFDSIPSDLGTLMLSNAAGGALAKVTLLVTDMRGGFSGGTIATSRDMADAVRGDAEARALVFDPYSLSPDRDSEPDRVPGYDDDERDLSGALHEPELGWMAPFIMAPSNTRVVRRSNALAGYPYSKSFRYREAMGFGEGVAARAKATGMTAGVGALGAAMGFGPTRAGIGKVLPKPGEGPTPEERAAGRFTMEIHGWTPDGQHYVSTVSAQGDPGYAATSVMLAETVLLLASGDPELPARAGVLTPATGLGIPLVERLRAAGFTFETGPAAERDQSEESSEPDAGEGGPSDEPAAEG
ncbi:MAG: saccharopine dehydrogenase NADP-binding domain-containing protein [Candidatus Nanopelagicales bacterium]